jgi:hypothetical protein
MLLAILNFRQLPGQLQRIVIPPVTSSAPYPRLSTLSPDIPSSMQIEIPTSSPLLLVTPTPQANFNDHLKPYTFFPSFWPTHAASTTIHHLQWSPSIEQLSPGLVHLTHLE